jgi:hypothetical protein
LENVLTPGHEIRQHSTEGQILPIGLRPRSP